MQEGSSMAFYHVSGGRAYGPSEPGESLKDYRARVRKAYGSLHGITFGTRDTIHPMCFHIPGISR